MCYCRKICDDTIPGEKPKNLETNVDLLAENDISRECGTMAVPALFYSL